MAVDLAERQIREGTASSQVITHFLKLGTTREKLEQHKLEYETELLRAKTEQIAQQGEIEILYKSALSAMRKYGGEPEEEMPDEY